MTEAMPITLEEFLTYPTPRKRLAGLDLGTKTIGVAISDTEQTIATGLETISRKKFTLDAEKLLEIASTHDIAAFIIGLPLNMDGSEGPRSQSTRAFAKNFGEKTDIPLIFWDERLSTVAAERTLLEADTSRDKRKQVIDKLAATYILQGALDRLAQLRSTQPNKSPER